MLWINENYSKKWPVLRNIQLLDIARDDNDASYKCHYVNDTLSFTYSWWQVCVCECSLRRVCVSFFLPFLRVLVFGDEVLNTSSQFLDVKHFPLLWPLQWARAEQRPPGDAVDWTRKARGLSLGISLYILGKPWGISSKLLQFICK